MKQRIFVILSVSLFCYSQTVDAVFSSDRNEPKKGIFVGLAFPYSTINSAFDGKSTFVDRGAIYRLPNVESNYGFEILLGYNNGINRALSYAFGLAFTRAFYNVNWLETERDADYFSLSVDGRLYFLADKLIQPYVVLGFGFPDLFIVKDDTAMFTTLSGDSMTVRTDVRFRGTNLKAKCGILHYLNRNTSIWGGVSYRVRNYSIKGSLVRTAFNRGYSIEKVSGNGLTFEVGVGYTF